MDISEEDSKDNYYLGRITNFCYLKQKGKSKRYLSRFAQIENDRKTIGVCGNWYTVAAHLNINEVKLEAHGYVDLRNYVATVPDPKKESCEFCVTQETYDFLQSLS